MNYTHPDHIRPHLLFECISGSQAYGTQISTSDIDLKGVYVLPPQAFYSLEFAEQVNSADNNCMYYELRKFTELLAKNNPNMLELLATPEDCVRFRHPLLTAYKPVLFLSKLAKDSFAGYAMTQIRKARGLNKKILNPVPEQRKSILDFCYILSGQGTITLQSFLSARGYTQNECGLSALPHAREMYALYHDTECSFKGIVNSEASLDVALSSIPEGLEPVAYLSFNKDGYSKYCKDYKSYRQWEENRNEARYENTIGHGKNYDAKNMMHTFRLLDMAIEIGRSGQIVVRRPNRDFLLDIRAGKFEYNELLDMAEQKLVEVEQVFQTSSLPDEPDLGKVNELLIGVRTQYYSS
ncbi:MAG: nucleotidyltransferase domain-containing protein [Bacteroidia bacterium]|jgi:hypothetical protein|nr:nucleotidyltransferase domain-containing protein [Bacteroidia bacterium]